MKFSSVAIMAALFVMLSCEREAIALPAVEEAAQQSNLSHLSPENMAYTKAAMIRDDIRVNESINHKPYMGDKAACDDCSPNPSGLSGVSAALSQLRYEYTGSSEQDADDNSACDVGSYNTCGGWLVLTSSGSANHRSELKYRGNLNINSKHTMEIKMVAENLPSSGGKGVTIAQIHSRYQAQAGDGGSTRPPLRMEIVDGKLLAIVADHYDQGQGGSDDYPFFDYNGGVMYITLEIVGDGKAVYAYARYGNQSEAYTIDLPSRWQENSNLDEYYYFKTGAYQQVSGGPPRVSIAQLTLSLNQSGGGGGNDVVTMRKGSNTSYGLDGNWGGANDRQLYVYSYNSTNINQQWVEIPVTGDYYRYQKRGTEYCIDGGNGGGTGNPVKLYSCSSTNQNQHWKKVDLGNNYFRLEKRNSSSFSIDGNSGTSGTSGLTHLWNSSNNNNNQKWLFTVVDTE